MHFLISKHNHLLCAGHRVKLRDTVVIDTASLQAFRNICFSIWSDFCLEAH